MRYKAKALFLTDAKRESPVLSSGLYFTLYVDGESRRNVFSCLVIPMNVELWEKGTEAEIEVSFVHYETWPLFRPGLKFVLRDGDEFAIGEFI